MSGALCQDVMIFKVQDDGIGMDGARLAQVCAMLRDGEQEPEETGGFGTVQCQPAYPAQLWQGVWTEDTEHLRAGHRDLGADFVPGREIKRKRNISKKITPFEENNGKIVNELFII